MEWKHFGYRSPDFQSYLVHGTARAVERVGTEKITELEENSFFMIRAQQRANSGAKWERSLWVGQCVPDSTTVIFSVSAPVKLHLSVANHVEKIKAYQYVLRRILQRGRSLADVDFARFQRYMLLGLPPSYVITNFTQ